MFPVIADLHIEHRFPTLLDIVESHAYALSIKQDLKLPHAKVMLENYCLAVAYYHAYHNPRIWGYKTATLQQEWLKGLCLSHYTTYLKTRRVIDGNIQETLKAIATEVYRLRDMTGDYLDFYLEEQYPDVERFYFDKISYDDLDFIEQSKIVWQELARADYFRFHLDVCVDRYHEIVGLLTENHRIITKAKFGQKLNQLEQVVFNKLTKSLNETALVFCAELLAAYTEKQLECFMHNDSIDFELIQRRVASGVFSTIDSLVTAAAVGFLPSVQREELRTALGKSIEKVVPDIRKQIESDGERGELAHRFAEMSFDAFSETSSITVKS